VDKTGEHILKKKLFLSHFAYLFLRVVIIRTTIILAFGKQKKQAYGMDQLEYA